MIEWKKDGKYITRGGRYRIEEAAGIGDKVKFWATRGCQNIGYFESMERAVRACELIEAEGYRHE